uniref:DekiORF139 n=1 Tax=Dendrolimus kikuchii nucleopolyhedrovirus TaxID=1219875 RepID=V9LSR9_9ABAC|nr:DekiORF139 [Dendrolimus kikuchii nucleopolyhedrovirus]
MSLASKLIVYNHFATFFSGTADPVYREHYQLYRVVNEYLTQSYAANASSCVERETAVARQLLLNECTFDAALKIIDAGNSIASLSRWYSEDSAAGIDSCVFEVLKEINASVSVDRRSAAGRRIFSIDQFFPTTTDIADRLKRPVLDRFLRLFRDDWTNLKSIADALNPSQPFSGWWYNKFCVTTYIHRIANGAVPNALSGRLSAVAKAHIQLEENDYDGNMIVINASNCPDNIAQIYGRFCGIGKEHFSNHKMACVHILFQYLRGTITHQEQKHCCYKIIKEFGMHCREVYDTPLRTLLDTLYINSHTDKGKNALFDVLCATSGDELDIDFFYYVVEDFMNNKQCNV